MPCPALPALAVSVAAPRTARTASGRGRVMYYECMTVAVVTAVSGHVVGSERFQRLYRPY